MDGMIRPQPVEEITEKEKVEKERIQVSLGKCLNVADRTSRWKLRLQGSLRWWPRNVTRGRRGGGKESKVKKDVNNTRSTASPGRLRKYMYEGGTEFELCTSEADQDIYRGQ